VVAITEDDIRELALFKGEEAPVTSCYLDVDGAHLIRHQDVVHQLERLLRVARTRYAGDPSVARDLDRIEEHVRAGFDRSRTRGLALFSCSAHDLWKVVELPVPVRDQVVVNHAPSVRQLEMVVDEHVPLGVLLADKQRARMFVFELGELVEAKELFEQLPRSDDDDHSYTKDHGQSHVAARAHQHLRHAAAVAFEVFKTSRFERLVIGAPDEIARELESVLHPYLRERIEGRCSVPPGASLEEIREEIRALEAEVERRKEAETVARLRDEVGSNRRGVAGLDSTLKALMDRRVDTLVVSAGFSRPGWRCEACRCIHRIGRTCPVCGAEMMAVEDVAEEAIEEALRQSCSVEMCRADADLDVLGGIGALLRY
jgi:peptide chain release factor subunit 1